MWKCLVSAVQRILVTFVWPTPPLVCQTLEMMKEAGVPPNTYCMNSIMGVSVQARQPNTALEVFKEMERDGIPRDVVSTCVASRLPRSWKHQYYHAMP